MIKPKILITNDDGIRSPGIELLAKALIPFADVTIVAPETEQSAISLAITIRSPLRLEPYQGLNPVSAWSVNGTPADCVKLALNVLYSSPPDLIVSGINRGNNAGRNILYSGTVAGVIEGSLHDIPGIAFSCYDEVKTDFDTAVRYIPTLVQELIYNPLPRGTIYNVNFPSHQIPIKGLKMARQGLGYWAEDPNERKHPAKQHSYYWLGTKLAQFEEHAESDVSLLQQGYITVVPLHMAELTHHQHFEERKEHFEHLFPKA